MRGLLFSFQEFGKVMLTICLVLMLALEPVIHCLSAGTDKLFHPHCKEAKDIKDAYSIISAIAMLLYWFLHTDLTMFPMRFFFSFSVGHRQRGFWDGALPWRFNLFDRHLCQHKQQLQPKAEGHCRHMLGCIVALGDCTGHVLNLAFRVSN